MTRLALQLAPPVAVPRRFLLSVPWWGMAAGALMLGLPDAALQSRWQPGTLALVHVFTLGVLGNAMVGSLLQFLPAAAGVPLALGARGGAALHAAFNLGAMALVALFLSGSRLAWWLAVLLLPSCFAVLALASLPGLWRAVGDRALHLGLGIAIAGALLAAAFGACLLVAWRGLWPWPWWPLVDVHAAWGVLGWALLLLVAVARVVMPMFLGTTPPPAAVQKRGALLVPAVLAVGSAWRLCGDERMLRYGVAAGIAFIAAMLLHRLARAPRPRRGTLGLAWRVGLCGLLAGSAALAAGAGVLAGVCVFGVGLSWLVLGMLLEITAFLGWIELHRRFGRGTRLPAVQRLLPDAGKRRALLAQAPSLGLLPLAALYPVPWTLRLGGAGLILGHAVLLCTALGVRRRIQVFLAAGELP